MDELEAIHSELEFSRYTNTLKAVNGVWQSILRAQQAARRDPSKVKAYRSILEKAVAKARLAEVVDGDTAEALGVELNAYATGLFAQHRLDVVVLGRLPSDVQAWMRKWYPQVTEEMESRLEAFYNGPSTESLRQAKQAVHAFVETFCGNGK